MALTIKSSNNFEVDVTAHGTYRKYAVKHKYQGLSVSSNVYNGSSEIEFIYAGKNLVTEIVLVDSNKIEHWLYGAQYINMYTQGSEYEYQYVAIKSDVNNTLLVGIDWFPSSTSGTKAEGIRFAPTRLLKVNTTNHTTSTGYYSDFGIDLYHDGTKLYRSAHTILNVQCYMYYLNDILVAVYNHSNVSSVQLSYFGGEIPSSIRGFYLPKNTLLFVCQRDISQCVDSPTTSSSSSSGPTVLVTNNIKISISSTLDSVVFEDTVKPDPVF